MTLVNLLSQYRDQLCPIILDLVEKVASKYLRTLILMLRVVER